MFRWELVLLVAAALTAAAQVTVPFVGCETRGQVEAAAPKGKAVPVPISQREALALAYYKAGRAPGVLAPRGWQCENLIGSSGDRLEVWPPDGNKDARVIGEWRYRQSMGRWIVADRIGRIFPAYRSELIELAAAFETPMSEFPTGPFATDKLTYRNSNKVIFRTPPEMDGLGTLTGLKKNSDPIDGVSMLVGADLDLFEVVVRLPARLRWLTPVIISASTYK